MKSKRQSKNGKKGDIFFIKGIGNGIIGVQELQRYESKFRIINGCEENIERES